MVSKGRTDEIVKCWTLNFISNDDSGQLFEEKESMNEIYSPFRVMKRNVKSVTDVLAFVLYHLLELR